MYNHNHGNRGVNGTGGMLQVKQTSGLQVLLWLTAKVTECDLNLLMAVMDRAP